jgi:hypothetical protein
MRRFSMKAMRIVAVFIVASIVILMMGSCDGFETVSILDRLTQFLTDLNSADRSTVYLNFDAVDTENYALITPAAYWDSSSPFPLVGGGQEYSFTSTPDNSDPLNVTAELNGPAAYGVPKPVRFVMVKTGTEWFIHMLYLNGIEYIKKI